MVSWTHAIPKIATSSKTGDGRNGQCIHISHIDLATWNDVYNWRRDNCILHASRRNARRDFWNITHRIAIPMQPRTQWTHSDAWLQLAPTLQCSFKIGDRQSDKKWCDSDCRAICNARHGIQVGCGVIRHQGVSDDSDGVCPLWRSHSAQTEILFPEVAFKLGFHDRASLDIHLEAVIDRVWRYTWQLWSSEFRDTHGGRELSNCGPVLGGGRWTARRALKLYSSVSYLATVGMWQGDLIFELSSKAGWWHSILKWGTREAEDTFNGIFVIMRMKGRGTILHGCCTRCMLYSVYGVLGVCCARCYPMILAWRDREGWLNFVFCNDDGRAVNKKERDGDEEENDVEVTSGCEQSRVWLTRSGWEDLVSVWFYKGSGLVPAETEMVQWLTHQIRHVPVSHDDLPHLSPSRLQLYNHLRTRSWVMPLNLSMAWSWVYPEHSIHQVQHILSTAYTAYCVIPTPTVSRSLPVSHLSADHVVLNSLHSHYFQLINELSLSSNRPLLLNYRLKIDCINILLQSRSIMAFKCISKPAQSWPLCISPN